jgi:hypothetical protein
MKKMYYPKPKKLNEEILDVDLVNKYRKLNCVFYEHCLDHASDFIYESFSCKGCEFYYPSSKEYDIIRIKDLLKAIKEGKNDKE